MKIANQMSFDYSTLDAKTRSPLEERARKIHALARVTAQNIVLIGKYLTEAKEIVGHGGFLKWIKGEFAWSDWTAKAFMRVARQFKSENFSDLQIDVSALYKIAAPSTPQPVRAEVMRRAEAGERVTNEAVVAMRSRYEETGELPDSEIELIALIADVKRENAEAKRSLPSPAKARQMAIASGQHTLDSTGVYRPPVTEQEQKAWDADRKRVDEIQDFLEWVKTAPTPEDMAQIIKARGWLKEFRGRPLAAAVEWLIAAEEEICKTANETSSMKSSNASSRS